MNLLIDIFDFFLPRFCASCKLKLNNNEEIVCMNCMQQIKTVDEERIKYEYQKKFTDKIIISDFFPLYIFEKDTPLREVIHQLKYNKKFVIGKFLGKKLGSALKEKIKDWDIDVIIPVPLHHLKKAERGYNQSLYIAKGIGEELRIKVGSLIIKRKRFTQSQTTMNKEEREANIKDAFSMRGKSVIAGKNILLVDDVITTGATIKECGKVLLETGANKVFAASAAIAD